MSARLTQQQEALRKAVQELLDLQAIKVPASSGVPDRLEQGATHVKVEDGQAALYIGSENGTPVSVSDIPVLSEPPANPRPGQLFLLGDANDTVVIVGSDGEFRIFPSLQPITFLTDGNGNFLTDDDGNFLVEEMVNNTLPIPVVTELPTTLAAGKQVMYQGALWVGNADGEAWPAVGYKTWSGYLVVNGISVTAQYVVSQVENISFTSNGASAVEASSADLNTKSRAVFTNGDSEGIGEPHQFQYEAGTETAVFSVWGYGAGDTIPFAGYVTIYFYP